MKINIIAIIVLAFLIYLSSLFSFLPEGLEAQAAADQVKTGVEYLQARGEMKIYAVVGVVRNIFWFFIGWNIASIVIKFFIKTKQNEE